MGGPEMAPHTPPLARRAPGNPWRASITGPARSLRPGEPVARLDHRPRSLVAPRGTRGAPRSPAPLARCAPGNPWRASITGHVLHLHAAAGFDRFAAGLAEWA